MYYTQQDLINWQIDLWAEESQGVKALGDILKDIIDVDKASDDKERMREGVAYYKNRTDVLDKDYNTLQLKTKKIKIDTLPNNKIPSGFHRLAVIEKVSTISPITFSSKTESTKDVDTFLEIVGGSFDNLVDDMKTGASNKGSEWLHYYIDEDGELKFTTVEATNSIPIFDTSYQNKLMAFIRYYETHYKASPTSDTIITYVVEVYTNSHKYVYEEQDGIYVIKEEIPHIKFGDSFISWEDVPFIELKNNAERTTDLELIKANIDDYDNQRSQFSNKVERTIEELLHVAGYDVNTAEEREIAREEIAKIGAVFTNDLNGKDKVEFITSTVQYQAMDSLLDRISRDITRFGMTTDLQSLFKTQLTNVAIQTAASYLVKKCQLLVNQMKPFIREIIKVVAYYSKITPKSIPIITSKNIDFEITLDLPVNYKETVETLELSGTHLSDETKTLKNPYAAANELKKIEEQEVLKDPLEEVKNG